MIYARADRRAMINGPAATTGRLIHDMTVMALRNIFSDGNVIFPARYQMTAISPASAAIAPAG